MCKLSFEWKGNSNHKMLQIRTTRNAHPNGRNGDKSEFILISTTVNLENVGSNGEW